MQNLNDLNISIRNNSITFNVKVIPNSSVSKIIDIADGALKIKLNSPPIENKANKEVVALLSKVLDIPKSSIELIFGDKNKLKTFSVPLTENEFKNKIAKVFE